MGTESKAAAKARIEAERRKMERKGKLRRFTPYGIGVVAISLAGAFMGKINRDNADVRESITTVGYGDPEGSAEYVPSGVDALGEVNMLVETGLSDSFAFVVMGGLVAILMGGYTVMKARSHSVSEATPAEAAKKTVISYVSQWDDLRTRKNDLMVKWARYETDVALMIDYPIMTDYTDPVIAKVITAMQNIRTEEMLLVDEATTPVYGSKLLAAVNRFDLALTAAEKYARRYGQTKLDPREQKKLSTARTALNLILDEQAPAHEVEAAYKSLRSSLRGIIDLPEKSVLELETKMRRELTAA